MIYLHAGNIGLSTHTNKVTQQELHFTHKQHYLSENSMFCSTHPTELLHSDAHRKQYIYICNTQELKQINTIDVPKSKQRSWVEVSDEG